MTLIAQTTGDTYLESAALGKTAGAQVLVCLYTNNLTPVKGSVIGDFLECLDSLYVRGVETPANWTLAVAGGISVATGIEIDFLLGTAATLYGYFVLDTTGLILLWAEKFTGGPIAFAAGGGTLKLTPQISFN